MGHRKIGYCTDVIVIYESTIDMQTILLEFYEWFMCIDQLDIENVKTIIGKSNK